MIHTQYFPMLLRWFHLNSLIGQGSSRTSLCHCVFVIRIKTCILIYCTQIYFDVLWCSCIYLGLIQVRKLTCGYILGYSLTFGVRSGIRLARDRCTIKQQGKWQYGVSGFQHPSTIMTSSLWSLRLPSNTLVHQ